MISHVIAVSIHTFPVPDPDDDLAALFDDDPGNECLCVEDIPEDDGEGYLDVVTTTLVFHPDTPDAVTMLSQRRDLPGQYAPYDFPRLAIVDLLNFGVGGSDDSMFAIARDDANPDWVFVNHVEHPLVYARLRDIEDFLSATYAASVPETAGIDDHELEALLRGAS